ncbi:MAG: type II toxin-antitoxin system VapC family toxin [Thermodesulfobacteriota bacterium]
MEIFVDTSAFVAITNRSDQYHLRAQEFLGTLDPSIKLHTSNYIIDETITRIRMIVGHKPALTFGKRIFSSRLYTIHYIGEVIEKEAFRIFEKYLDKKLSFTDCTSFALMKKLGIKKAFAFDEDFVALGFEIVPTLERGRC